MPQMSVPLTVRRMKRRSLVAAATPWRSRICRHKVSVVSKAPTSIARTPRARRLAHRAALTAVPVHVHRWKSNASECRFTSPSLVVL
eukprot:2737744-Prymnesium_polylepis.1